MAQPSPARCPLCGYTAPDERDFSYVEITDRSQPNAQPTLTRVCDRCITISIQKLLEDGATIEPQSSRN